MTPWLDVEGYASDRDASRLKLAELLRAGQLCLFLGAGCNDKLGLPLWWKLAMDCRNAEGLPVDDIHSDTSTDDILALLEDFRFVIEKRAGTDAYHAAVASALYKKHSGKQKKLPNHPLLSALGALMMSSRRGAVTEVLTLNFDDVLESYLALHGFVAEPVFAYPQILSSADVTIYHPHGFLPKTGRGSEFLILDQYSYDKRHGRDWNAWLEVTRRLSETKVFVAVGLSGNDPILREILTEVGEGLKNKRPTGFWLMKGKGKKAKKDKRVSSMIRRNIVPLEFDDYKEFPAFLLSICQSAVTLGH